MKSPKAPTRNWRILAMDPGTSPAICALWDRGESVRFYDPEHTDAYGDSSGMHGATKQHKRNRRTLSLEKVRKIIEYHDPHLVVIEKVWVRPKQGIVSSARLVFCAGVCEGLAYGLGRNIMRVFPQTWMKFHGLLTTNKAYHRWYAAQLAPQHAAYFTRVTDHNRADAMLMALCGLAFIDKAYEQAVRKGAPLDFVPKIDVVR